MTPLYLDIETIPGQSPDVIAQLQADAAEEKSKIKAPGNYKDEAKIAEYVSQKSAEIDAAVDDRWRKTSFDGALGQIVAASIAIGNDAPVNIWREDWQSAEEHILRELFAVISGSFDRSRDIRPVFVGHNIVAFDLRFIFQRSIMLGIKPPQVIPFNARPWDNHIFDTMTAWAGFGNRVSLDKLCRVFGIPTKGAEIGDEIDGSKVWDFVQAGRVADVATYCGGDVDRVREIHRRMTFFYNNEEQNQC